ncbi:hypothetical protein LRP60_03125, partial [Cutibacterium acnes]|nr:hypothetical protein [Cutibacterium acnes]
VENCCFTPIVSVSSAGPRLKQPLLKLMFGHELVRGAIADATTQEISTAMNGQDPHDFADGFSKKTAHTLGNAAHTSFPGLHTSK